MNFENNKGITSIDTQDSYLSFSRPFRLSNCYFEEVSFEQFCNSCIALEEQGILHFDSIDEIREHYGNIKLPRRSTPDAAGYDFYMPFPAVFTPDNPVTLPTGIRVILNQGTFLMCVPRSGLGFKYGAGLINTTGVIDASYSESDNEGHIMAKITTRKPFKLDAGDRFMQGIILPFFITEDDNPLYDKRNGGFGSTGGTGK